jgi:DNA topoisomerase-1
VRDVASDDVNEYIREASGGAFTAKDFRTWAGTVLAYRALRALEQPATEGEARRNVVEAIRETAEHLGNTPAVCRSAYVHPVVVDAYLDGRLRGALVQAAERSTTPPAGPNEAEERAVVRLLRRRIRQDARRVRTAS